MRFTCYNESITAKLLTSASFRGLQYCIKPLLLVPILKNGLRTLDSILFSAKSNN